MGHDNARDDTHAKDNGKYLQPIAKEIGINASSGFQPQGFQHHQIACKPNGKSRKNEVDADGKGELKAGQQKRCLGIWHEDWLPWRFPMGGSIAGAPEIAAPYNFRVGMPMIRFPPFLSREYALACQAKNGPRSEEHTSELQSLMRISYAVFCLKKKKNTTHNQ